MLDHNENMNEYKRIMNVHKYIMNEYKHIMIIHKSNYELS